MQSRHPNHQPTICYRLGAHKLENDGIPPAILRDKFETIKEEMVDYYNNGKGIRVFAFWLPDGRTQGGMSFFNLLVPDNNAQTQGVREGILDLVAWAKIALPLARIVFYKGAYWRNTPDNILDLLEATHNELYNLNINYPNVDLAIDNSGDHVAPLYHHMFELMEHMLNKNNQNLFREAFTLSVNDKFAIARQRFCLGAAKEKMLHQRSARGSLTCVWGFSAASGEMPDPVELTTWASKFNFVAPWADRWSSKGINSKNSQERLDTVGRMLSAWRGESVVGAK